LYPSPPVTELAALTATVQQQSETIACLTRMLEQVMADLANAQATISTLTAPTAAQTVEPPTESAGPFSWFWARWWPLAATLIVALVLATGLLTVPR